MSFRIRTKEEALNEITELVEAFDMNKKQYLDDSYNEANVRSNFIDKFFEALNWDVRNDEHLAERFRDVIVEDRLEIDGQKKAPDYSFCIKGQRVFYVEAKKPSVDIKNNVAPAFQVRRYAYTKGLKLSILTDFEEFAVYEISTKPRKNDKASVERIKFITYKDYIKEFDYLWDIFSYDAVEHGGFDNYVGNEKKLKGTSTIDKDFLDTIENWRKELAKNIALRNVDLSLSNLNFAVQKIIDRIIFLRIVEEKGIEQSDYLKYISTLKIGTRKGLINYFKESNDRYNSGLFKEYDWLNKIVIDDAVLNKIINELYFPECPYAWNELPIEILGNIYEKFLGSTITFRNVSSGNHTAIVEAKPEIKKVGGVYYTPKYIVDYIVKETLGKKLKKCSLAEADKITICEMKTPKSIRTQKSLLNKGDFTKELLYQIGTNKKLNVEVISQAKVA